MDPKNYLTAAMGLLMSTDGLPPCVGATTGIDLTPVVPNGSLKGSYGWHPPTGRSGAEAFGSPVDGAAPASFLTINRQPDGGMLIAHHGSNRAERRHPKKGAARRLHFGR